MVTCLTGMFTVFIILVYCVSINTKHIWGSFILQVKSHKPKYWTCQIVTNELRIHPLSTMHVWATLCAKPSKSQRWMWAYVTLSFTFSCADTEINQSGSRSSLFESCVQTPTQDQEVILTDNPISRCHPVPGRAAWPRSPVSENSSWEVTGRVSPHLSEPHWLPHSHSHRLLPSHSLTPVEGLREERGGWGAEDEESGVSVGERDKQIEDRKRERKTEVAREDL